MCVRVCVAKQCDDNFAALTAILVSLGMCKPSREVSSIVSLNMMPGGYSLNVSLITLVIYDSLVRSSLVTFTLFPTTSSTSSCKLIQRGILSVLLFSFWTFFQVSSLVHTQGSIQNHQNWLTLKHNYSSFQISKHPFIGTNNSSRINNNFYLPVYHWGTLSFFRKK